MKKLLLILFLFNSIGLSSTATAERYSGKSAFDGDWIGYFFTVKGRDNDAICIEGGSLTFRVSRGAIKNGASRHPKYAVGRGPGTMSYWGDVDQDGLLRGYFKGGYVTGDWVGVLREDGVGIGIMEPNMGLTSEPYECPIRMVMSRKHTVEELKSSELLRGEKARIFNEDSFIVPAIGDLEEKLKQNSEALGGVQSEEFFHYALGLINGYSLDPTEHSYLRDNYQQVAVTADKKDDRRNVATHKKHFTFSTETVNRDSIAVVIGNKNYSSTHEDVADVDFAHNDHEEIINYLTNGLGYRSGNIISVKDATQAEMNRIFGIQGNHKGDLYNWVKKEKSDVFVYYSGHGVPDVDTKKAFLMPVDAVPDSVEMSGYSLEQLYKNLSQIDAKSITVVLDACFSGQSHTEALIRNASALEIRAKDPRQLLEGKNFTVITASSGKEIASWDEEYQLGLLTRYFLEGVSGAADDAGNKDKTVTLNELKEFIEDEVSYQARRNYRRKQHPQISGNLEQVMSQLPN